MQASPTIAELAAALAAAQGEFTNPERNRTVTVATKAGGSYSFTYATIDAVFSMARPILAKHGLALVQCPSDGDGEIVVTTRLMHKSGEWIESSLAVKTASADPQALGSLVTYLKRYSYCAMLGIAADEDDDGNAASGNEISSKQSNAPKPACPLCGKSEAVYKDKNGPGWYCWKKKDGCGHQWDNSPADAPPADKKPTPYEHALALIEASDIDAMPGAIDKIAAGQKLTREEKIGLVNIAGERAIKIDPARSDAVVNHAMKAVKELDHTFA